MSCRSVILDDRFSWAFAFDQVASQSAVEQNEQVNTATRRKCKFLSPREGLFFVQVARHQLRMLENETVEIGFTCSARPSIIGRRTAEFENNFGINLIVSLRRSRFLRRHGALHSSRS